MRMCTRVLVPMEARKDIRLPGAGVKELGTELKGSS